MAIAPNTTFTAGQVLTSDQANRFPRGVVAYTSNATQTIAGGYLTGLDTTYTFAADRMYRISVAGQFAITGNIILEIHLFQRI
jgi:hypothetical protein